MSPLDSLVERIRGEFREMPGLRLTLAQACRLWQVDAATCEVVLCRLLAEGFLGRTPNGMFVALPTTVATPPLKMQPATAAKRLQRRTA
jgi:hypothetical protein